MASAVTEGCPAERRKKRGRKRRQSDLPSGSSGPLMQVSDLAWNLRKFWCASVLAAEVCPKQTQVA